MTGVAKENIINYPGKVWWNTIGREKCPILFKVAPRLFVIPASSAASERVCFHTYEATKSFEY